MLGDQQNQDWRVGVVWVVLIYSVWWGIATTLLLDKRERCERRA